MIPRGFSTNNPPTSISFLGRLYGEAASLLLARAYREATDSKDRIPEFFKPGVQ